MDQINNIATLTSADKVAIFQQIAIKNGTDVDTDVLESVSTQSYDEFISFCDEVFGKRDVIRSIGCEVTESGQLIFQTS